MAYSRFLFIYLFSVSSILLTLIPAVLKFNLIHRLLHWPVGGVCLRVPYYMKVSMMIHPVHNIAHCILQNISGVHKKRESTFFKIHCILGSAEIMGNKNKPCFKKILFTHGYTNFKIRKRESP